MDPSHDLIKAQNKITQLKRAKGQLEKAIRGFVRSQAKLETQLKKTTARCKVLSKSMTALQNKYNKLKRK